MRLRNILILVVILIALGGYFYFSSRPEPPPPQEKQLFVWLVEQEAIEHIVIALPRDGGSQAFLKKEDRLWYFDEPGTPQVDMQRWGGGIPLLLSGPAVDRVIDEDATEEKLAEFGLAQPRMAITLTMENEDILYIKVGDSTPDGINYYIQVPDSNAVALVDYTWFDVLSRLVNEPPYPPTETD